MNWNLIRTVLYVSASLFLLYFAYSMKTFALYAGIVCLILALIVSKSIHKHS